MAPPAKSPLGRYRLLSPTAAVRVSPLCLGAMNFGDKWKDYMGSCNQAQTESILDFFYEQVCFFFLSLSLSLSLLLHICTCSVASGWHLLTVYLAGWYVLHLQRASLPVDLASEGYYC